MFILIKNNQAGKIGIMFSLNYNRILCNYNFPGIFKINRLPYPISEEIRISPSSRSAMVLQMERPKPVPWANSSCL